MSYPLRRHAEIQFYNISVRCTLRTHPQNINELLVSTFYVKSWWKESKLSLCWHLRYARAGYFLTLSENSISSSFIVTGFAVGSKLIPFRWRWCFVFRRKSNDVVDIFRSNAKGRVTRRRVNKRNSSESSHRASTTTFLGIRHEEDQQSLMIEMGLEINRNRCFYSVKLQLFFDPRASEGTNWVKSSVSSLSLVPAKCWHGKRQTYLWPNNRTITANESGEF